MKQQILNILSELAIDHETYEHIPVFTCDEAKGIDIPGRRVKSLLLRNKKATNYYMVVLPDIKKLDINIIREYFQDSKLSFASPERMFEKIGVTPGSVSPFALVHNSENDIVVVFDSELKDHQVGFHPGQNDHTTVLGSQGVEQFLDHITNRHIYLEL